MKELVLRPVALFLQLLTSATAALQQSMSLLGATEVLPLYFYLEYLKTEEVKTILPKCVFPD